MPESLALVDRLRAQGLAAVVSGAGPSVLVLASEEGTATAVRSSTPADWAVLPLEVDVRGARVERGTDEVSSR
jgi:homoserine kinase